MGDVSAAVKDRNLDRSCGELAGQVAVVTGGSRGVGRMLARVLAGAGAAVAVTARSEEQLSETVSSIEEAGGRAMAVTADVTEERAMAGALREIRRRLGPVDLLINNAGINGPVGPLWELETDVWWRTFEVNLRGIHLCSRLVLPEMLARRQGRIINVSSQAGVLRWPLVSAYSISKAAVTKLTENLAIETRSRGVSVFSIHPGLLRIGLTEEALARPAPAGSAQAIVAGWVRRQMAGGKDATPEQAARLVILLASGRADALSGCHLSVHDDLDALLARADEIRRHDLLTLRLRTEAV